MKLKRLFSAKTKYKFLFCAVFLLFFSCASTNISVPVPGQGAIKTRNIYAEYYMLGDSYFKLEDYRKAAEYYELAMKKKEQYWAAYYKLAKCYVFVSDWNNALPMYKTILKRDPENASLKASIAYIYSMQGNYKKAIPVYQELLEEQPKNKEYLENYLAVLLSTEKKFKKRYSALYDEAFETLKTEYPEDEKLTKMEEKYKLLMDIQDTDDSEEDEEDEEESEESEAGESEESPVIE